MEGLKVGDWVRYYDEGWHFGKLLGFLGGEAQIEHPGTKGGRPQKLWAALKNVEAVQQPSGLATN